MEQCFELIITGTENHTWQGRLRLGGETAAFRSELELLLALGRLMPAEQAGVPPAEKGGGPWTSS